MGAYDELIDEYLGTALSPEEMRDLALLQVKNASVQDDAVQNAVANHQGLERANRSALEEYLIAQEQQAAAESQRALEMAQQRYLANQNSIGLLSSTVGLGKEGKRMLANLERDNQDILRAFPQIGKASEGEDAAEAPAAFDIAKMLESKDYSPEMLKRFFDENDWEVWDKGIDSGDLELYNALINYKLGALPEGMKEKMQFKIRQRPDLSKELRLNSKYSGLLDLLSSGTQGDIIDAEKKRERDEANAKIQNDIRKATDIARALLSDNATGEEWDMLKEDEKENLKRHINDIPADIRSNAISFMRAMNLIP